MKRVLLSLGLVSVVMLGMVERIHAQVASDGTLATTVNTPNTLDFTIDGGTRSGNNLFHSFSQFSVPTGGSALFNNATDIQTIFSRVTGGSASNIDGLLKANGTASLFLLNPSGILFGANAQVNIGGSFVGTTANSIRFADGTEFSAVPPNNPSLLTISVPVGLQMGSNPASITVQGTGHNLSNPTGLPPITIAPSATELRVQPEQTLALVGGNLNLNGATLTAPKGRVELGSVSDVGLVKLIPTAQGYALAYDNGQSFGKIQLTQKSLVDVSGVNAGSVNIQGQHIAFTDGSLVLAQNFGDLPGGKIHLQASDAIEMTGISDKVIASGIRSETFGTGASGDIRVITPKLTLQQGAGLNSITFGPAAGGKVQIEAGTLEITGFSPIAPTSVSYLATATFASGSAGDISVYGDRLLISSGASLTSATFGSGSSGKVTIRNQQTTVMGENPFGVYSNIGSGTFATGNAKSLTLETGRLQILDGGAVATTTFFVGNGGDLNIQATESIEISGYNQSNNSSINSSVLFLDPRIRQLFGLPDLLAAKAGNVSISTPKLILADRGTVSVTNQGSGDGGVLSIKANTIQLDRQASIQAETASGNGGNIALDVGKLLLLRNNSAITVTSDGNGNGGNITLNSPVIVGLENSDIVANAAQGKGGNIQITTQGIIGLQYRDRQTPENDITASSGIGVNGTVEVNNLGVDPNSGLVELSTNLVDANQQVTASCSGSQDGRFVITGRGGMPQNPTQNVSRDRPWNDLRDLAAFHQSAIAQSPSSSPSIVQANTWYRNPQTGTVELLATQPTQPSIAATCASLPQFHSHTN